MLREECLHLDLVGILVYHLTDATFLSHEALARLSGLIWHVELFRFLLDLLV